MKAPQPLRRRRGNDGLAVHQTSVLPISAGLMASLIAEFAEVRERRAPRIFHGPKPFSGGAPTAKYTDEQVLAIRKMRDWHGMTVRQIAEALNEPEASIANVAKYITRVHLDPGPRPAPSA